MRRRKTVRVATAAALGLTLLGGLAARAAFAEPATASTYPRGTTGTHFSGLAFDTCDAPSRQTMQAWKASPFGAVGIYVSGEHRACNQAQLTADWVRDVTAMGWKLLPLDVGRQAPCMDNPRLTKISLTRSTAVAQGSAAAQSAVAAARALGIRTGSPLYSDLEYYAGGDAACTRAVRSYVTGWTRALHKLGYLAGVYGNTDRTTRDLALSYDDTAHARPDAVWSAQWNGLPELAGRPSVGDGVWPNHQRVKQYRGDHTARHGGVALTIDASVLDAPVATVALPYAVTGAGPATARLRPHETGLASRTLEVGATVEVLCQAPTATGTWDKLIDGSFLPDALVGSGAVKSALPTCSTPYQVATEMLNLRAGPSPTADIVGTLRGGTLAWVICETPGLTLGRPGYWQKLDTGQWVSGPLISRPSPYERAYAVPLCSTA